MSVRIRLVLTYVLVPLLRTSEILTSSFFSRCVFTSRRCLQPPTVNYIVFFLFFLASHPVFEICWSTQGYMSHFLLELPPFLKQLFSLVLVPIGTLLLWKPVAESFGTNCNLSRVSVKLLQLIVSHGSTIFDLGSLSAFGKNKSFPQYRRGGEVLGLVQTFSSGFLMFLTRTSRRRANTNFSFVLHIKIRGLHRVHFSLLA